MSYDNLELKKYLRKLSKVIEEDYDFKFFDFVIIKRSKIDDLWVCLFTAFPEIYKEALEKRKTKYTSVLCFQQLFDVLKGKFVLSKDYYLTRYSSAVEYIGKFPAFYENDINRMLEEEDN